MASVNIDMRRNTTIYKHNRTLATFTGVLTGVTVLTGVLLTSSSSSAADTATVNLSLSVQAACSLTIAQDTLTATISPNDYGTLGTSTITSICNDPAGLAIYAVGYTNNTYGNNALVSTVSGANYTIDSNATPSGTTPANSEWNMTLAPVTGQYAPEVITGFGSAHAIPDEYTKVVYRNAMTDIGDNATGAKFTATFDAYISSTQPAGTYTGKVKFLLVHPNVLAWADDPEHPGTSIPAEEMPSTLNSLQNVSEWASSVTLGQTVEAFDERDDQVYKVTRLKTSASDTTGTLWMSNLNLGAQPLAVAKLDSSNTHLPTDGSKDVTASAFMAWNRTTSGTGTSYNVPKFTPLTTTNTVNGLAEDIYGNKYGTLYNYAAASAGTYVYASDAGTGNAEYDLCPKGWRLPIGGSTGEFKALYDAYGITNNAAGSTSLQQNLGFSLAGLFGSGAPYDQGARGFYWSSTWGSASNMYSLGFGTSYVNPAGSNYRYYGFSIRCVLQ